MTTRNTHAPTQHRHGPQKESVWDYPRPPRLEKVNATLRVVHGDVLVAETVRGYRILETSHPPVYYFPPDDVRQEFLVRAFGQSFCEYKGTAEYWSIVLNARCSDKAAWSYSEPTLPFLAIKNHFAFYASRVDFCWVDDERAIAQEGDCYGGWITSRIVGPFKGGPGTFGW